MNTLITILLIILGIVAVLLIVALFMKRDYNIHRKVLINASQQEVFDYIRLVKNQDNFNKWCMVEPSMHREFKGTDGTVGFIYGWSGKKAGEGEQEIKSITEGKSINTEIRFVRPMEGIAYTNMVVEPVTDTQTKVIWSNASTMKYPINIMLSKIEKMLAKDMDISLNNLKTILEQ